MQFARSGGRLAGTITAAESARLGDILDPTHGAVQYELVGGLEAGRLVLRLKAEATVRLECQRCLEPFEYALAVESVLRLARNERELDRWESEDVLVNAILAEAKMDIRALVEDEILLSLPVAPRHPEGGCSRSDPT